MSGEWNRKCYPGVLLPRGKPADWLMGFQIGKHEHCRIHLLRDTQLMCTTARAYTSSCFAKEP